MTSTQQIGCVVALPSLYLCSLHLGRASYASVVSAGSSFRLSRFCCCDLMACARGKYRAKTLQEKADILREVDAGLLPKQEITKKHAPKLCKLTSHRCSNVTAPMADVLEDVCFADYVDVDSSAVVCGALTDDDMSGENDDGEEEDEAPVRPSAAEVMAGLNAARLFLSFEEGGEEAFRQIRSPLCEWVPPLLPSMLRLLYQRCLLEMSSEVLDLIYQVWEEVVRGAPLGPLLTAACPYLSSWLCLLMHPAHLQVDVVALQWLVLPPNLKPDKRTRRPGSTGCLGPLPCLAESAPSATPVLGGGEVYLAGAESLNESPAERERLVLQCRCMAAKLLGLLSGFVTRPMPGLEVPPVESPMESFARLMLFHLASKSALQRMMTAAVMAHWVSLHSDHLCPPLVRDRVLECLGETLYFDEMASSFTRLQQDARDFIALLRHFQLPLGSAFPASVVLTVDQVIELVTTVFQGLVQEVRVKPKVLEASTYWLMQGVKRGYKRSKPRSDERERLKKSRVVIAPQCEPNKLSAPVPKM
ncbi:hypothetical protein HPB50_025066 [Hyalomma asiaticum]|uniref:Uncharacterized protein n=1 Tax=Hyalomma asiaticum TaxID=266040 RepID=A0ACB7TFP6_HYAAI|nr:hypothetical protein HPB50_025066 [Hyalomma asiaticum]